MEMILTQMLGLDILTQRIGPDNWERCREVWNENAAAGQVTYRSYTGWRSIESRYSHSKKTLRELIESI
jgi:hypothetical protein